MKENADVSTHAAGHWADETRAMVAAIRNGTMIRTGTTIYDTPSVRGASGAMKGSEQLAAEVSRRARKEAQK